MNVNSFELLIVLSPAFYIKAGDFFMKKFGRLIVLNKNCDRNGYWLCKCECGNQKEIYLYSLKYGKTKSCGCLAIEVAKKTHTKHGLKNHALYSVWIDMKNRCYNKKDTNYKYYGARKITVCSEWKSNFRAFYDFAINNGWEKGLEIDRRNNDGSYKPSNCRFVTRSQNNKNRRAYNKLGVKYVYEHHNGYDVSKTINGKKKCFGIFKTLEEAKRAAERLYEQ